MNFTLLTQQQYEDSRYQFLLKTEEGGIAKLRPYVDSRGFVTIGVGFNLNSSNVRSVVLAALGIQNAGADATYYQQLTSVLAGKYPTATTAAKALTDLDNIMSTRNGAGSRLGFASEQEIKSVFATLAPSYEGLVDQKAPGVPAYAQERVALYSIAYNTTNGNGLGTSLRSAIASGNRAEAWFEIRYKTNPPNSDSGGIAKRRYYEAQALGLYDGVAGAPTAHDAKQIFAMLTERRDSILQYEALYGTIPDSTASNVPSRRISAANTDYALTGTDQVQTLTSALQPAREAFVLWVNTQLPIGEVPLSSGVWNPAAIFYNDPNQPQPILDARSLDGKGNGMDKNLVVGSDILDSLVGGQGNDMLLGGKANDTLYGGTGDDTLYGGEDDDLLNGEAGNDRLVGGTGNDSYNFAGAFGSDVVEDSDGAGSVKVNDTVLTGGKRKPGESTYRDEATSTSYVLVGSTLLVTKQGSPQITINNWSKTKNLGITLVEDDDPPPPPAPPRPVDPLVIDLDGDGLELRAADGQVLFDHNADGIRTGTGWASPDDALLVWDRNANGLVDTGRELFGIDTLKSNGQFASNGFDALADLDSNADGQFSSADAQFNNLQLWRDLDQDGVTDAGELQSLSAAGIASISLATSPNGGLVNNNRIDSTSVVTRANGSTTTAGAIDFAQNLIAREFTSQTVAGHVAITTVAQGLPELTGSGMVRDLREAASLNTPESAVLVALLQQYSLAGTRDAQLALLQPLLDAWAATSTHQVSINTSAALAVTANGPGSETAVQAWARLSPSTSQHAATLERFYGSNFVERFVVATPGGFSVDGSWGLAPSIDQKWQAFQTGLYSSLILQTRLKPYVDAIVFVTDGAGPRFDTAALSSLISARGLADPRVKEALL
jgi:GH24 family phage-related lysozyme (muramidase)